MLIGHDGHRIYQSVRIRGGPNIGKLQDCRGVARRKCKVIVMEDDRIRIAGISARRSDRLVERCCGSKDLNVQLQVGAVGGAKNARVEIERVHLSHDGGAKTLGQYIAIQIAADVKGRRVGRAGRALATLIGDHPVATDGPTRNGASRVEGCGLKISIGHGILSVSRETPSEPNSSGKQKRQTPHQTLHARSVWL